MTIITTDQGKVPLPEGWDLARACDILRGAGHTVTRITRDGVDVEIPPAKRTAA
jgi:hypothetical protein